MTASWPSAAARRSMPARSSPSWRARPGRCGISRMSATGGPARIRTASLPIIAVPDHGGHGLGGRPRRRHHAGGHPHQEGDLPSAHDAEDHDLRSGTDDRHAAGTSPPGPGSTRWRIASKPIARPAYHPMADGIAVEGIRLVKEYLPRAYRDGTDLEARANMMAAAAMGATAFQKGLGAIHALSHPVGRALRHPSRPDQRGLHALRAGLQPRGHRGRRSRGSPPISASRTVSTAS